MKDEFFSLQITEGTRTFITAQGTAQLFKLIKIDVFFFSQAQILFFTFSSRMHKNFFKVCVEQFKIQVKCVKRMKGAEQSGSNQSHRGNFYLSQRQTSDFTSNFDGNVTFIQTYKMMFKLEQQDCLNPVRYKVIT